MKNVCIPKCIYNAIQGIITLAAALEVEESEIPVALLGVENSSAV